MRYKSLDIWRGVACLCVVVFHSTYYSQEAEHGAAIEFTSWLWVGVPIFFVISGYCIAAATESCVDNGISSKDFFYRRFHRIYPPYWIAAAAFALIIGAGELAFPHLFSDGNHGIARPWWLDGWQLLGNSTLTESWRHHVIGSRKAFFLDHAWTLCYEEQFYAVMGIILLTCRRAMFHAVAIVTLSVICVEMASLSSSLKGFFFDGHWLEFAAGVLVYRAVNYGGRVLAASLLILATAWQLGYSQQFAAARHASAFVFAVVLIGLHRWDRVFHNAQMCVPLAWCGQMCYSLYLVHWPVCKGVSHIMWLFCWQTDLTTICGTVPLCVCVSLGCGRIFYLYVERRFVNAGAADAMALRKDDRVICHSAELSYATRERA